MMPPGAPTDGQTDDREGPFRLSLDPNTLSAEERIRAQALSWALEHSAATKASTSSKYVVQDAEKYASYLRTGTVTR